LTIPHRGTTSESSYFVTANVFQRKSLFQVEKIASLFIEVLMNYRSEKKYLLHEFVVMPDHLHLIITPTQITLERALQLIKGGFSFGSNKNLKVKKRRVATKLPGQTDQRFIRIPEVQRLHLAESGKAVSG
jgi:putative transposase